MITSLCKNNIYGGLRDRDGQKERKRHMCLTNSQRQQRLNQTFGRKMKNIIWYSLSTFESVKYLLVINLGLSIFCYLIIRSAI